MCRNVRIAVSYKIYNGSTLFSALLSYQMLKSKLWIEHREVLSENLISKCLRAHEIFQASWTVGGSGLMANNLVPPALLLLEDALKTQRRGWGMKLGYKPCRWDMIAGQRVASSHANTLKDMHFVENIKFFVIFSYLSCHSRSIHFLYCLQVILYFTFPLSLRLK